MCAQCGIFAYDPRQKRVFSEPFGFAEGKNNAESYGLSVRVRISTLVSCSYKFLALNLLYFPVGEVCPFSSIYSCAINSTRILFGTENMVVYFLYVFLFLLLENSATAQSLQPESLTISVPSSVLTIEQAVNEAVEHNLNLFAERINLNMADASLITARLRPNPVMSLSADHQDFLGTGFSHQNGAGPQEFSLRIDVPMERGGKRQFRIETATYAKEAAEVQILDAVRKLTLDVALACIDLLQAKANLALAKDNFQKLEEVVRLNEVKMKDGSIAPIELTRSQVAMMQYRGNVKRADLELATAKTKLQNLLGRTISSETLDIQGELKVPLRPAGLQLAALEEQAFTTRPDLQALERNQARSQADLKLQLAQAKVDYIWGLEYRRQQGVNGMGDTLGLFLSVPLPLFNRNEGEIARVTAEHEQLSRQVQALKAQIQTEVNVAWQEFQTSRDLVESIEREMLNPAEQARDTVAYTYRAGASSLVEFLDAQRAFNETIQSYYEAEANYRRAVIKLNAAVGREVTA